MSGRALRQRIKIVWDKGTPIGDAPGDTLLSHRYVPRSFHGGTGWGVFDKKLARHLTDDELVRVSIDELKHATYTN